MKPKILLTNDDGIEADGLRHLYDALSSFADLWIVAPAEQQSGVGAGVTLRSPLTINGVKWEANTPAWKVSGTPADCVRLGLNLVVPIQPDLIVSGINKGSNAGRNVLYSGTIGGVIEATNRGLPGIAFSCENYANPNYAVTKPYVRSIVEHLLEVPLPRGTFLNVNFPDAPSGIKGVKLARQGKSYIKEKLEKRLHPEGNTYYWMGCAVTDHEEDKQSDIHLLKEGFVTAVPIHIDEMTDHAILKERKEDFETFFSTRLCNFFDSRISRRHLPG